MKYLLCLLIVGLITNPNMKEIYVFPSATTSNDWRVVNDGVMGGVSTSSLVRTNQGYGQFSGHVSLENNGGFASIQLNTSVNLTEDEKVIVLRLKGDGKAYEFRLKGSVSQAESYVHPFTTTGEWETIRLPLSEFYPQFRGRRLSSSNFNFNSIGQVSFLIANKQEEDFAILIDSIGLE